MLTSPLIAVIKCPTVIDAVTHQRAVDAEAFLALEALTLLCGGGMKGHERGRKGEKRGR